MAAAKVAQPPHQRDTLTSSPQIELRNRPWDTDCKHNAKQAQEWQPKTETERQWHEQRLCWLTPTQGARKPLQQRVIGSVVEEETLIIDGEYYAHPIALPEIVDYIVQDWLSDGMFSEVSDNSNIGE